MKIRTFTTASTTLLGAALISYGQTQNDQRPDTSPGAPATQQTSGAAGASQTPGVDGGRSQSTTDTPGAARSGDIQRPGQTGSSPGTTAGRGQNETRTTGPADSTAGARQQPAQPSATLPQQKSVREIAEKYNKWEGADQSEVMLDEIPEEARESLKSISTGAEIKEEVAKMKQGDEEMFCATLTRDGLEDLKVFVMEDGKVASTKQKAEFSEAPQAVRSSIQEKLGDDKEEPEEFYRVIADGQTIYAAKVEDGEKSKMMLISLSGETAELKSKDGDKEYKKND